MRRLRRYLLTAGLVLAACGAAEAQATFGRTPGTGVNPGVGPNAFNRNQQPLSPYLNLLRGNDPATNYYYNVRPGLQSGGYQGPAGTFSPLGPRQSLFGPVLQPGDLFREPAAAPAAGGEGDEPVGRPSPLAPTGQGAGFNTARNFSVPGLYRGSAGPGGAGLGASAMPARRPGAAMPKLPPGGKSSGSTPLPAPTKAN